MALTNHDSYRAQAQTQTEYFKAIVVRETFTVYGDFTFGDAISDSITCNGLFKMGTNASPLVLTAGTPTFTLYTTCAGTSGSTSAEPFYMKSVLTGAGQVGGRAYFLVTSNVLSGPWVNAVKADVEFGSSGGNQGLASSICAEMTLPNRTTAPGHYYPLEIEWIGGSSTTTAGNASSGTGCIYINATGTTTDFADHAGLIWLNGVTSTSGDIYYGNTIRMYVTSSMTSKYLVLSGTENSLDLGAATTPIDLSGAFTTGIQIDADGTTAISVTNNFSGTNIISLAGTGSTAGINISGTNGTGIVMSAQTTAGITMAGDAAYNPIHIGTKANTATGGLNMSGQDSYDNHGGIMIFGDDNNTALASTYTTSLFWSRYLITANQTSNTATGAYLQMKLRKASGSLDLTTCDYSASKHYIETSTATVDVKSGGLFVVNATLEMGADLTNTAGVIAGIKAEINDGTNTLTDTAGATYGMYICKTSGSTGGWPVGLAIGDSGATTGIDIGACTTGINVAANTVIPQFLTIGTSTNPMHWDGVASNILVYTENTDTTPASVTANKFVLSAAQSAAVTSGRLENFRAVVTTYSTNNVTADLRGIVGQMELGDGVTYQGSTSTDFSGCFGVIASIYSGGNVTANTGNTGHLYPLGIFFGLETGTSLSGEDSYIYIYNYGKVCPNSVIKLYNMSTPEVPTYFFDMQNAVLGSSSGPVYTGDVNPTGSTGDDALGADGHIKILVGSTPYYIPIFGTLV